MSSHKTYVKELKPLTFITFDSDTLWEQDSKLLIYAGVIPDESENGLPIEALLHYNDNVNRPSYLMGQRSFIQNQPTDNYSIVLAPYDKDDTNSYPYEKTWLEIPYTERLKLDKSFTISFLVNKENDDSFFRDWIWDSATEKYKPANYQNGYNYINLHRTIFRKGNRIGMRFNNYWGSPQTITFTFPNNSTEIQVSNIPGFINNDVYVVMTHDYIVMDDGRYYTKSTIYWDTRIIYEYSTNPIYGVYDGGNTSPFEFGGNQDPYDYNSMNDRATSRTRFDQIAIFDYALRPFQITNLYKKVYDYETMIIRSYPRRYYKFDENYSDISFKDYIQIEYDPTQYDINYIGNSSQIQKKKPGIHGIYGNSSAYVRDSGMLYCKPLPNNSPSSFYNPSGSFTIEFFASIEGSEKGVLLSIQDDVHPFRGLCLYVNTRNNIQKSGSLQLSISENEYILTPEKDIRNNDIMYNDQVMRHYLIRRVNNFIELWINAVFIAKIYMPSGNLTSRTSSLYMFGLMPGHLNAAGYIQHLVIYDRALSQHEIEMRVTYLIRYEIAGRITVQGIGQRLLIRIYSFNSGELILQDFTDSDGNYKIQLPSDDYINFTAMDLSNLNIRPRLVGPVLADEYYDLPFE